MRIRSRFRRNLTTFSFGIASALFVGLVWQGLTAPPPAYGQVPDSGRQRQEMVSELQAANKKLAEITTLLKQIRDQAPSKDVKTQP